MVQHHASVKDTMREFQEMLDREDEGSGDDEEEKDDAATGALGGALEALDLLDEGFYGDDPPPTEDERVTMGAVLGGMARVADLYRYALAVVDEQGARLAAGAGDLAGVAAVHHACVELNTAMLEAGDALYPPHIADEVADTLRDLVQAARAVGEALDKCSSQGEGGDGRAAQILEGLEGAVGALTEAVGGMTNGEQGGEPSLPLKDGEARGPAEASSADGHGTH
jgi:hypothetical protein